ncbi:MAG: hypothetical protein LC785_06990 [Acidobacteria bacterium]|nr:hypothetical protein [Acidobacteriota bacterium]MCA1641682.1 hypothetical protein [Acidobacteriota bacterium]
MIQNSAVNRRLKALTFESPPSTPQGHSYAMVKKQSDTAQPPAPDQPTTSRITNEQIIGVLKGVAFLVILYGATKYFVYTAVPEKVKSEVGSLFTAKDGPLERIVAMEQKTQKIDGLETSQNAMREQIIRLDTKFDVYFDKTLDKNTAEEGIGRAINRAISSQDHVQQTAALDIAKTILDKAISKRIVIDYKKANQHGLAILKQSYKDDQKPIVKADVSKLAEQRTAKSPAPAIPENNKKESEYIKGGQHVLDGTFYKDVTFVNSKITYGDGWLGLENVRFINCTFEIAPEAAGKAFYLALFKSDDPIPSITVMLHGPLPPTKTG